MFGVVPVPGPSASFVWMSCSLRQMSRPVGCVAGLACWSRPESGMRGGMSWPAGVCRRRQCLPCGGGWRASCAVPSWLTMVL